MWMTYSLLPTGARHDAIAVTKQTEAMVKKMTSDRWTIGTVVTDNAGQSGRARRTLTTQWPRISFQICFVHDLNNLVKAALKSDFL